MNKFKKYGKDQLKLVVAAIGAVILLLVVEWVARWLEADRDRQSLRVQPACNPPTIIDDCIDPAFNLGSGLRVITVAVIIGFVVWEARILWRLRRA